MKRTNSNTNSCGRHTGTPAATDKTAQEWAGPYPEEKLKRGGISPRTPAEQTSTLRIALTSRSEQQNPALNIKLGLVNHGNLPLPQEITIQIAQRLKKSSDRANLALSCRPAYQAVDLAYPMRRVPGLVADLKSTCKAQLKLRLDNLQAFDDHLRRGGAYDQALLTPISSGARFAASIAMMIWASRYSRKPDAPATQKLALARVKTEFTALEKETNAPALNAQLRAAFYAILNMSEWKPNARTISHFSANDITPFLDSDFLDDETHLNIVTLLLRAPNAPNNFSVYAKEFITELALEDVVRITLSININPALLHERFAELRPERLKDELVKFIEILDTRYRKHHKNYSIHDDESFFVYCLCAVFSSFERLPEDAYAPVMASLSRLMRSMMKSIQTRKPIIPVNNHFFRLGFNWFDKKNSKDWNGYQSTFGNQIDSFSRGYLARLLREELRYSPDKDEVARMRDLMKQCLLVLPTFKSSLLPFVESPELREVFVQHPELRAIVAYANPAVPI